MAIKPNTSVTALLIWWWRNNGRKKNTFNQRKEKKLDVSEKSWALKQCIVNWLAGVFKIYRNVESI